MKFKKLDFDKAIEIAKVGLNHIQDILNLPSKISQNIQNGYKEAMASEKDPGDKESNPDNSKE